MALNLYFSAFVLTMCAIDLVWTASARINTWWNKNVPLSHKTAAVAEGREGRVHRAQAPQRSDWYAFFHCSDLVGREPLRRDTDLGPENRTARIPAGTSATDDLRRSGKRAGARLTLS